MVKTTNQPQPIAANQSDSRSDSRQLTADNQSDSRLTTVFVRVGPAGCLPLYATVGSAGCDLYAAVPLTLRPGETRLLPLDLVMAIEPGIEAQIRPRSGLSLRTELRLPNAPGTIDSDYRSEIGVILQNTFNQTDLAARILADPNLAVALADRCRSVKLADYLRTPAGANEQLATEDGLQTTRAKAADLLEQKLPDLAGQSLLLDEQGNPYGTLYIQTGDRIAQMIFSRYLQARFIEHPQPETVGQDRGGGFGSTGA